MLTLVAIFLPLAWGQQNPICPLCSMGAPGGGGVGGYSSASIDQSPQQMTFSSYQRNPLAMYQGDATLFGTELGRAIAQRIQQIYSGGVANTGRMNSGSSPSYNSYPEPSILPPPSSQSVNIPYSSMEMINLSPPQQQQQQMPMEFGAAPRGGCPYCFGGSGNGGYAAAPPRHRRVEFVKDKKN